MFLYAYVVNLLRFKISFTSSDLCVPITIRLPDFIVNCNPVLPPIVSTVPYFVSLHP